jgi:hypothetical protein
MYGRAPHSDYVARAPWTAKWDVEAVRTATELHRCSQINMHSSDTQAKGDISTLPAWGHFYFALTGRSFSLTVRPVSVTFWLS